MNWSNIFPTELTFFSVLWYIFLFYLVAYIIFHIYVYYNDLDYVIDCKKNDRCLSFTPKSTKDPNKDSTQ